MKVELKNMQKKLLLTLTQHLDAVELDYNKLNNEMKKRMGDDES